MKSKFTLLALIASVAMGAQSNQVTVMAGYKSVEVSASRTLKNELILGVAVSATCAQLTEERANKNDRGNIHAFNGKVTPAVFGLFGAEFDRLSLIGKLGTAYVNQSINGKPESQRMYFAAGMTFDYKLTESLSLRASYDSVAGALTGISINF